MKKGYVYEGDDWVQGGELITSPEKLAKIAEVVERTVLIVEHRHYRLGHISKQGNALLRFLLVEAAQVTVRSLPEWRSKYFHLAMRRGRKIAKVAMARKLAIQLFWMMRKEWDYEQVKRFGPHAGQPENRRGVQ